MENFITFKNANIFFSDIGKGTVVVLLHGFLENSTMWNDIIPEISKRNRIITIDLLGHGKTDCLGYLHPMELFAETLKAVLNHLKIRKYILVGHSLGGYISLALAKMNSTNIKGLCLLNSTSYADSKERISLRKRAIEMAQKNYEPLVKMSVANLFQPKNTVLFKDQIEVVKQQALQTSLQGYIAAQEGMIIRANTNAVLAENSFKKLLIIGKQDPVLSYENSLEEAKKTNTEVVILNGGHMSYIENKLELILALKSFLKNC